MYVYDQTRKYELRKRVEDFLLPPFNEALPTLGGLGLA